MPVAAAEASHHLYPLITDLGLILATAAIAVILFKKIRQPLVLGYLIAGFLAGSNFDFFPSVKDETSIKVWAEIGVIFLLFSLGLEFSFKKLMKVGGTASITAMTQIGFMVVTGFLAGRFMGWEFMDCVFLGVILSISSTTIILKSFEELGVKAQKFVGNVLGSLIVQDIIAILMMVLVSTIAVSQQFSGTELVLSVMKLAFFLTLWFVGGIFFIPTLLKKAKKLMTDEVLLILSIALCLMMVILAANVGFSPALGAFIMGSIIAETTQAEHIEHLMKPVKDLFGAIFFVSVGMLINIDSLITHWVPVVVLVVVTILGQSLSSTFGALLSGQPLKQSVQTGMSLSQIGEFSFIIATLGMNLGVTSKFLYPIVVAVSAVTTFTTPFMIKASTPFADWLSKNLPRRWVKRIERYSANAQAIRSASTWQIVLRASLIQIVINSVIIVAGMLLAAKYLLPLAEGSPFGNVIAALATFALLSPFLWALSLRRVATKEVQQLLSERRYRGPILMLILFRFLLAIAYLGLLMNLFFSSGVAAIALAIALLLYLLFPKKLNAQYHRIENHFLKNFNDRELAKTKRTRSDLIPWDEHMAFFNIAKESNIAGKSLQDLQLREEIGINIAFIRRGEVTIRIPGRNERLFPGDEVCAIGTEEQLEAFRQYLDKHEFEVRPENTEEEIIMKPVEVLNPAYIGKDIRQSQIREKTHGLIVGLERGGHRKLNPESNEVLQRGDILWIVGEKRLINQSQISVDPGV